jgi:hypothetical protein
MSQQAHVRKMLKTKADKEGKQQGEEGQQAHGRQTTALMTMNKGNK